MHSLRVGAFVDEHQEAFLRQMEAWIRTGQIKYKEDLWAGLDLAPAAFRAMLTGENFGKTLVGVGDDPTLDEAMKTRRAGSNILPG